jgi:hypothetical protein
MEPNYGYRHTRWFIVFLIILFCGWVVVAHGQTSYTGNLVNNNNWTNGYPVSTLTCWQAGDPNCSPGTPYIRPNGNINFSYNATELYQARAIADVLPNSGTGLIATGFQFNWRSKNGNGWDDGRLDTLQAYVQMYSKSGQWIEAQTYSLNFLHNWTDFSWSGNFTKERRGSDLGTILYGFYGRDNNNWVGPYGPEVTNVSFSLRYQPDPCVVNPLHSTECPGFLAAINRPVPGVQTETTNTTSVAAIASVQSSNTTTNLATGMNVIKLNAQREQAIIESAIELATSAVANENRQAITASASTTILNQSQQRTATTTTESGTAGQEQDLTVPGMVNFTAATTTQNQISMNQRTNNRTADSTQTNQEQESAVTMFINSNLASTVQTQNGMTQRTNRNLDSSQMSQEQDTSTSSVSTTSNTTLTQFQPVTVQRFSSSAADSSQTNSDSDTMTTSAAISITSNSIPGQLAQTQRTSVKANDISTQQDQEQFMAPPSPTMMSFTLPAVPTTNVRTTTRNQDVQNSTTEQEQSVTATVVSSVAIVPVQLPTVQKINQRTESQAKVDTAVDNANTVEQFVQQNTTAGQVVAVPTSISQPNQARTTSSGLSQDIETNSQVSIAIVKMPEISAVVQSDQVTTGLPERPATELQLPSLGIIAATISNPTVTETAPAPEPVRPPQTEIATADAPANTIATALIDRTNPLNDMLNGQQQMAQSGPVFAGPAVKSNTADNDLAGGVSISQIARVPAGFDVYTNLAMREIAFYQPREIYRGQRTVDNVRALRSLGQDARHQEMIDQQYRR